MAVDTRTTLEKLAEQFRTKLDIVLGNEPLHEQGDQKIEITWEPVAHLDGKAVYSGSARFTITLSLRDGRVMAHGTRGMPLPLSNFYMKLLDEMLEACR